MENKNVSKSFLLYILIFYNMNVSEYFHNSISTFSSYLHNKIELYLERILVQHV